LEVIKNIARASTKEKGLIHNIWAHDVAARLKMRRKSVANEMGLSDDWDVGTFPSSSVTINETSGGGLLKGAALAAGLLAGGGTGGFLLSDVINSDPQPVVEAVRETVEKSVPEIAFGEFMLELEQQEILKQKLEAAWVD
tara:strand:- start:108 stop:527 length:420 start_codon:yes stop_codon:yes gene_type:complete